MWRRDILWRRFVFSVSECVCDCVCVWVSAWLSSCCAIFFHLVSQLLTNTHTRKHTNTQIGPKPYYSRTLYGILSVTALPMLIIGIVVSCFGYLTVSITHTHTPTHTHFIIVITCSASRLISFH